jgi:hypothetical protein
MAIWMKKHHMIAYTDQEKLPTEAKLGNADLIGKIPD